MPSINRDPDKPDARADSDDLPKGDSSPDASHDSAHDDSPQGDASHDPAQSDASNDSAQSDASQSASPPADKPDPLQQRIDLLTRALADALNSQKRAERDAQLAKDEGIANLARAVVPLMDDIRRAVFAAEKTPDPKSILHGLRAMEKRLLSSLKSQNVRETPGVGSPFDHRFHDAVGSLHDDSVPQNSVALVAKTGWTLNDKLIVAAQVLVAEGTPAETSSQNPPDDKPKKHPENHPENTPQKQQSAKKPENTPQNHNSPQKPSKSNQSTP